MTHGHTQTLKETWYQPLGLNYEVNQLNIVLRGRSHRLFQFGVTSFGSLVAPLVQECPGVSVPESSFLQAQVEAASTLTDPHALVTQTPWGWLRRILTLETQSAELRPMSNNSSDRGYAAPTADLFTYPWPQHLKGVTGGAEKGHGAGLGWASPRLGTCKCAKKANQRLGHRRTIAVLRYCLSQIFFFVGCQNGWRDEAQIPATEMWHWEGILISTRLLCVLQSGGRGGMKALYPQSVVKRGCFSSMMTPSDPSPKNDISCVYVQNGWGDIGGVGVRVFIRISSNPRLEVL